MRKKLRSLIIPKHRLQSAQDVRRAYTVVDFAWLSFLNILPFPFYYYYAGYIVGAFITVGSLVCILLFSWVSSRFFNFEWIAHLIGINTLLTITLLVITSGGVHSPAMLLYVIGIHVAFDIAGKRIGILWASIYAITLVVLAVLDFTVSPFHNYFPLQDEYHYLLVICIAIFGYIVLFSFQWELGREEMEADLEIKGRRIIRQEKMASLGHLTAGIAHEINNPLSFIGGNAQALKMDLDDVQPVLLRLSELEPDPVYPLKINQLLQMSQQLNIEFCISEMNQLISGIEKGSDRITEIIGSLNYFSHPKLDDKVLTDVPDLLDATLIILKNDLEGRIEIKRNYKEVKSILVHPNQLMQVFLNIIENAIESIGDRGTISIDLTNVNHHLVIRIVDDGKGMSEEVKGKLFEPFYTTKPIGDGTGLGLSISYGIVQAYGGKIEVESELGKGSKFEITMPYL